MKKPCKIKQIVAVYETITKYGNLERFSSSSEVFNEFQELCHETKEYFYCLHLDSKNYILAVDLVSMGSLNASIVHPREVFKSALLSSASALIFVHNHPSGNPEPSKEDLEITDRLCEGGKLLGIRILDHIIIGQGRYVSLADKGLIP